MTPKEYYLKNKEVISKWKADWYQRNKEQINEKKKKYYAQNRQYFNEKRKSYPSYMSPKYALERSARGKLQRAVRSGRMERKPCKVCGEIKSEGHHGDYSRPLDVQWLCARHHTELHKGTSLTK